MLNASGCLTSCNSCDVAMVALGARRLLTDRMPFDLLTKQYSPTQPETCVMYAYYSRDTMLAWGLVANLHFLFKHFYKSKLFAIYTTYTQYSMAPLTVSGSPTSVVRSGCGTPSLRRQVVPGRCPSRASRRNMTVQAAAAVSNALKVYEADTMDAASLKEFASRPRVDFQSILERVRMNRLWG